MTFDFYPVPRIQFGAGQFDKLPDALRPLGTRVLVIHNADALVPRTTRLLESGGTGRSQPESANFEYVTFYRQRGEPTTDDVERAVALARQERCDCLIALGGGSAIDCTKATAALLTNQGSPLDYMEVVGRRKMITRPCAPWIAIPTTAGTGAEATRNAVIALAASPRAGALQSPGPEPAPTPFKASIRSEHLLPKLILIDPQLHLDLPPAVTARSGMDALCQCIESYTSSNANPLTDPLALQGISLCARSLKKCYGHGNDITARQDMALAALLSGVCLTNAGLGAVHGFAAPLGAHFPIPHGLICATLLPHVIQANITTLQSQDPHHPTLHRYATIGRTLTANPALPHADALTAAVHFTRDLNTALNIPPLSSFNFSPTDIPPMIRLARKASSMRYNPVVLNDDALAGILLRAS
jgi:alcohol dehydrogenase class IV